MGVRQTGHLFSPRDCKHAIQQQTCIQGSSTQSRGLSRQTVHVICCEDWYGLSCVLSSVGRLDSLLSMASIDSVKSVNNWRSLCAILFSRFAISSNSRKSILLEAKTYGAVFAVEFEFIVCICAYVAREYTFVRYWCCYICATYHNLTLLINSRQWQIGKMKIIGSEFNDGRWISWYGG